MAATGVDDERARALRLAMLATMARASAVGRTVDADVREAGSRLALALAQGGADAEAADALAFVGFTHRLGKKVLRYDDACEGDSSVAAVDEEGWTIAAARDGAARESTMRTLRRAFVGRERAFWREHGYDDACGFFSYVHDLESPSTNAMDVAALDVRRVAAKSFPRAARARWVEWWAHNRPHSHGHQMHFDSHDEGLNGIKHPICSVVVFVDGSCGGPTLVTNQKDGGSDASRLSLATRGWLVHPRDGRIVVFDGDYLHGVIPGRPDVAPANEEDARRVTVMFSFWDDMETHETWKPKGSARPFPPSAASKIEGYSWRADFDLDENANDEDEPRGEPAPIVPVDHPWERVRDDDDAEEDEEDEPNVKRCRTTRFPSYDECFQGF